MKCNLPFSPKQTPPETMTCLANFALSISYQPTFIDVCVKAGDGNGGAENAGVENAVKYGKPSE